MRALTTAAATAIAGPLVPIAALVEMDLPSPLYLCTGGINLVIGTQTYTAIGVLGSIGQVTDTAADVRGLQFTLSGVPQANIAMAVGTPVRGKAVRVKQVIFDPDTYAVLDNRLRWSGVLDYMAIDLGTRGGTATITVAAEHLGADLLRVRPAYWTDADQRARYSNDPSLQYIASQSEQRIVWPAASFFRK